MRIRPQVTLERFKGCGDACGGGGVPTQEKMFIKGSRDSKVGKVWGYLETKRKRSEFSISEGQEKKRV